MKVKFVSMLFIVVLLSGLWIVAPAQAQDQGLDFYCIGEDLFVDATYAIARVVAPDGSVHNLRGETALIPGPGTFTVYPDLDGDPTSITCNAPAETIPVPGCDALIQIPKTAVVGQAVGDARLYWAPGYALEPALSLEQGKTAWVLGVDETLSYYRIIWVCNRLWVPIGTMGPNPDAVWMSRPLPTDIVD